MFFVLDCGLFMCFVVSAILDPVHLLLRCYNFDL
jgi:hypothetical protein